MSRRKGSKNKRTVEFEQAYKGYIDQYGDPMEWLFECVSRKRIPVSDKMQAARKLIDIDPMMVRAISEAKSGDRDVQPELDFCWADDAPDAARNLQ